MKISIISIGNELIQGRTEDTNGTFLSKKIFEKGLTLDYRIQVPDDEDKIKEALDYVLKKSDIVFVIGGLGGTSDDITKETVAKYLNRNLIFKEEILKEIKKFFERMNIEFPELNKKVAYIIDGSKIHKNRFGFAPGLEITHKGKSIFLLPGMKNEFEDLTNRILKGLEKEIIYSKVYRLFGITECDVEKKLKSLIGEEIKNYVFYYPSFKGLSVKISINNKTYFRKITKILKQEFSEYIFSENDEEIEYVLGKTMRGKKLTVSIAESCTGGLISSLITDVPGSSEYFKGGVVVYSNESKIKILNINENTLKKYGAVSEEVANEMAKSVRKKFNTDLGISTTGIAGPTGGTKEKPVGLVYVGVSYKDNVFVKKYLFNKPRTRIKMSASCAAIFTALKMIK